MANQFITAPVWSPDGIQIATTDRENNGKIVRVDNGEATATDLPPYGDVRTVFGVSWSPDNKTLACLVRNNGVPRELVLLSLDSKAYQPLIGDGKIPKASLTAVSGPNHSGKGPLLGEDSEESLFLES